MKRESDWVKLLKTSEPFSIDAPFNQNRIVAILAEYKERHYMLVRSEHAFIGPEDFKAGRCNEYKTLLEAALTWKAICDNNKRLKREYIREKEQYYHMEEGSLEGVYE